MIKFLFKGLIRDRSRSLFPILTVFAGVFLVRYSIDNGLLGPTARIVSGLLFGAGLIIFGNNYVIFAFCLSLRCAADKSEDINVPLIIRS